MYVDTIHYLVYMVYVSGSGKTLAYLAPVISELRREEAEEGVVPRIRRPRALVVLPSRDLALQVLVSLSVCFLNLYTIVTE